MYLPIGTLCRYVLTYLEFLIILMYLNIYLLILFKDLFQNFKINYVSF
jgi:hypothetical protein